jgi:hypothetical protein
MKRSSREIVIGLAVMAIVMVAHRAAQTTIHLTCRPARWARVPQWCCSDQVC